MCFSQEQGESLTFWGCVHPWSCFLEFEELNHLGIDLAFCDLLQVIL